MKQRIQLLICVLSTCIFLWFYFDYDKYQATWWAWCNVTMFSLLFGPGLCLLMDVLLEKWLFDAMPFSRGVSTKFFTLLAIGVASFMMSGIYFTEPEKGWDEPKQALVQQPTQYVNYNDGFYHSRSGRNYQRGNYDWAVDLFSFETSDSSNSSDDDSGGEALLFIILLAVIVAMVLGSAFISHFWVFASIWGLSFLWLYYYRNYQLNQ